MGNRTTEREHLQQMQLHENTLPPTRGRPPSSAATSRRRRSPGMRWQSTFDYRPGRPDMNRPQTSVNHVHTANQLGVTHRSEGGLSRNQGTSGWTLPHLRVECTFVTHGCANEAVQSAYPRSWAPARQYDRPVLTDSTPGAHRQYPGCSIQPARKAGVSCQNCLAVNSSDDPLKWPQAPASCSVHG